MKELFQHLRYLIRRHNRIEIRGFGSLNAIDLPPLFDDNGNILLAPARAIYFEADCTLLKDSEALVNSYNKRNAISNEVSENKIGRAVDELHDKLEQRGMVIAGQLGSFFLKDGNIEFKANINSSAYNPFGVFYSNDTKSVECTSTNKKSYGWNVKKKAISLLGMISFLGSALAI